MQGDIIEPFFKFHHRITQDGTMDDKSDLRIVTGDSTAFMYHAIEHLLAFVSEVVYPLTLP